MRVPKYALPALVLAATSVLAAACGSSSTPSKSHKTSSSYSAAGGGGGATGGAGGTPGPGLDLGGGGHAGKTKGAKGAHESKGFYFKFDRSISGDNGKSSRPGHKGSRHKGSTGGGSGRASQKGSDKGSSKNADDEATQLIRSYESGNAGLASTGRGSK
jgi:hypothetical protein